MLDQMQRNVAIPTNPSRIISLVPSQTELLFDLGLETQVIGITKFCIHPKDKIKNPIKIGGTKKFNFDLIDKLNPDLIIGNKEENYQEGIERLSQKYPVWMSDIITIVDALDMIISLGKITNTKEKSKEIVYNIQTKFENFKSFSKNKTVAYFIWKNPLMVIGKGTFIQTVLELSKLKNVFAKKERYPIIEEKDLQDTNPDLIFLSSEPFPFQEKHKAYFEKVCPNSKVMLVDGEMFSWYGSRLLKSAEYIQKLCNDI